MANKVEVLSGYDSHIYLATEELKTITNTFTGVSSFTIDNADNELRHPKITIIANTEGTLSSISDGINDVNLSIGTLSIGDVVVLDFKNQEYTLNGNSILGSLVFVDSLLSIFEDSQITISISASNSYDVAVEYLGYTTEEGIAYLETFSVDYKKDYSIKRGYKTRDIVSSKVSQNDYSVSFSKLNVEDKYLNDIMDGKVFRVKFNKENPLSLNNVTHTLLGVSFESYKGGFNKIDDLIITDVKGFAKQLIIK